MIVALLQRGRKTMEKTTTKPTLLNPPAFININSAPKFSLFLMILPSFQKLVIFAFQGKKQYLTFFYHIITPSRSGENLRTIATSQQSQATSRVLGCHGEERLLINHNNLPLTASLQSFSRAFGKKGITEPSILKQHCLPNYYKCYLFSSKIGRLSTKEITISQSKHYWSYF